MFTKAKHVIVVKSDRAWEVRRKITDEVLGTFPARLLAELFEEAVESSCVGEAPQPKAARQQLAA